MIKYPPGQFAQKIAASGWLFCCLSPAYAVEIVETKTPLICQVKEHKIPCAYLFALIQQELDKRTPKPEVRI